MELNKTSILVVKKWIEEKRIALVNEMTAIRARIDVYTQMLKELETQPIAESAIQDKPKIGRPFGHSADHPIAIALAAAGTKGATAREVAAVTQLPIGTTSSRLSIWDRRGEVKHVGKKYFIVHSTQEDNNITQDIP
jgi:hypothetical protein